MIPHRFAAVRKSHYPQMLTEVAIKRAVREAKPATSALDFRVSRAIARALVSRHRS
jgi:hypothetical protein